MGGDDPTPMRCALRLSRPSCASRAPQGGDGLAADRNRQAEGRDQAAQGRDRRAETRDRAAERGDRTAGERDADAEARDRRFRDRARQAHEREDQVEAWQAQAEARDRAAEARDRAAEARDRQAEAPVAEELGLMEVLARAARDRAAATRDRIAAAEDRVAAAQDRVRWTRTVAQAAVEQAQAALAEARRPRTAPRRWRTAPRPKMTGGGLAATEPGRPMPAIRWLVRKNADGAGGSLPVVSSRPRSHVSVNRPSSIPFAVRYRRARSQHATPHAPLGYERGKAMAPSPNWEAQLDQLSTHRFSRLVRHTGLFVQRVRERWAVGQFVPSQCTVTWIDDLAGQVVTAERRLGGSSAAGRGGPPPTPRADRLAAPGAVLAMRDESEHRQLAAMRMAVRRAKDWEPAAHERAAELHERAAEVQARLGHQDRADQARRFAALARGRILDAYAEQAAWEATLAAFDDRNAARTRPPGPAEPAT